MLVLTRKIGESIVIDGGITITVVAVEPGRIRLGISAPRDVRIDREEVYRRRQEFVDPAIHDTREPTACYVGPR